MRFQLGAEDIGEILKRRFFLVLLPFLAISILGIGLITLIPPRYESEARMIVEDQQVRDDWVASAVSNDPLQRLEAVAAIVLAPQSLMTMAGDLGLFENSDLDMSERREALEDSTTITVERLQPTRRWNDPSTITVTIAYRNNDPSDAQRAANWLLTAFQNESIEQRNEVAESTYTFLVGEEEDIRRSLDRVIEQISTIKRDNPRALPENQSLYETQLARAADNGARIDDIINQTSQELTLLEMQRPAILSANTDPTLEERQLREMRLELERLRRTYQDSYPTVMAMVDEVLAMERELDPNAFRRRAQSEISNLDNMIADTPAGPERNQMVDRQNTIRRNLAATPAVPANMSATAIQFEAQVSTLRSRIEGLESQKTENLGRMGELEAQLAQIPVVASQLERLEQEKLTMERDFEDIQAKRAAAERSDSLERKGIGEQLTVLENPVRPEEPVSPNKPQLAIMIFVVSAFLAGGIALYPEVAMARLRKRSHVEEILPGIKVVEVPRFSMGDGAKPKLASLAVSLGAAVALTVLLTWTAYQTLAV